MTARRFDESEVLVVGTRVTVTDEAMVRELRGRSGVVSAVDFSNGRRFPYRVTFDGPEGAPGAWWPMGADELVIEVRP